MSIILQYIVSCSHFEEWIISNNTSTLHALDSLERPRRPATSAGRTFVFRPAKGGMKRRLQGKLRKQQNTYDVGYFQNDAAEPGAEVALPQTGRSKR